MKGTMLCYNARVLGAFTQKSTRHAKESAPLCKGVMWVEGIFKVKDMKRTGSHKLYSLNKTTLSP